MAAVLRNALDPPAIDMSVAEGAAPAGDFSKANRQHAPFGSYMSAGGRPASSPQNLADFSLMTNTSESAVSWGAIFAGAVGAAVLSLVLAELGAGLGLAAASPWSGDGLSTATVGVPTIIWLTLMQLLASALGGYLAGRLRSRWITVHTHEVYFRDTAHGFVAWGVSTLLMATLLSSAVGAVASMGAKVGASDSTSYVAETLLRSPNNDGTASTSRTTEVTKILANALRAGEIPPADVQYLGHVVANRTGMSEPDAEQRVTTAFAQLKQTADAARKDAAWLALWLVVSMLAGAFVASLSATLGGRRRDLSHLNAS